MGKLLIRPSSFMVILPAEAPNLIAGGTGEGNDAFCRKRVFVNISKAF
jgi:hypothetical protein